MQTSAKFYESFSHDAKLQECVNNVVSQLEAHGTSQNKPGMLLGKIQSGKTRGFLGVIAKAFDNGFDIAIVVTKGTKTLATQTVSRISNDFKIFIEDDKVAVFDIMSMPERLTKSERSRKLIIIAKKEVNNLKRVIDLFKSNNYPDLKSKKVLLVDDEADMAGVRFIKKKNTEEVKQGSVAQQLDDLRRFVKKTSFLQVTATPYALYLQPEDYSDKNTGSFVFMPKRPAFTELLPIHSGYVGGDDYFGDFDENDPRHYLFVEVPSEEQEVLRSEDGRSIRIDRVWTSKTISVLRQAVMTFILGVVVRRIQQNEAGQQRLGKFAMIIHNDTQKSAHGFQWTTVERIRVAFEAGAINDDQRFKDLFDIAYSDLEASVKAHKKTKMPGKSLAYSEIKKLISSEEVNVQMVNSDVQVAPLLDPATAELKLRAQANIFIGGSLLDRGITVPYLIAFYYGRDPKRMQADTVLQHSRMYGNRHRDDLAVTRFYTSITVFQRLRQIDDLETALREAFEKGGHDAGVVFIENDASKGIIPCAPNKISLSKVATVKPAGYYLPNNFDTTESTKSNSALQKLNSRLESLVSKSVEMHEVSLDEALEFINLTKSAIKIPPGSAFSWDAMEGLLKYYAKTSDSQIVYLIVETGRELGKIESGRKTGQSIVGGLSIRKALTDENRVLPALIMLRQKGGKQLGWASKSNFWWPVLAAPVNSEPCVFSNPK
ncbi:Z1 domain-containing protein [Acidovorax sp. Root217]|uniref:Z1 domain-containing protein n=1 Tax=Acidovorax sp. Root217 TaxID=1736492 RepID=UPI0009E7A8A9|nr:Z1 domain-containing protein [Acidovorax sp. Root217]